jgi:polar amino acid transport system substrate-binding protein
MWSWLNLNTNRWWFCLFFIGIFFNQAANAETLACDQKYLIAQGDSLSTIAQKAYNSPNKYSMIYYANLEVLTKGPSTLHVGQEIRIPCLDEANKPAVNPKATETADTAEAATTTSTSTETAASPANPKLEVQLLTAGDYQPFTDPSLPNGGLITELVEAALSQQNVGYKLTWINDWASHLDPLLKEKKYDMGFPWLNPGCPNVEHFRCQFLFSTPIFQMLEVLYTRTDKPLKFETDDDMIGHTLCRPSGYFTHDLERPGREWLKKNLVKLEQPQSVKDCFQMLMDGKVDAVAMNDFTGRETIAKMGLQDQVVPLPRELSVEGLHVLVHKTHPRATILMNSINNGLKSIQESGQYDAIMDKHLMNHWKTVESLQKK